MDTFTPHGLELDVTDHAETKDCMGFVDKT